MRVILLSRGLLLALTLWGCDQPSNSAAAANQMPPLTPSTSSPGVATLGPTGGNVSLPSTAEINFPAGAVPAGTRVQITDVPTPSTDPDFVDRATMQEATNIASRSVEVAVTGAQPSSGVGVKLFVPSSYIFNLPTGQTTRVLALSSNESDMETPSPIYILLPVVVNAADLSISFTARPEFFAFESAGNNIARFVVVTSP